MSFRTLLVLGLAVVCGASAAMGVLVVRRSNDESVETVQVLVARTPISRGQVVSEMMIASRAWPTELVPPQVARRLEDVIGRTALHSILPGEPVIDGKLADRDAGRGLASLIPDGRRAYAIQTSHVASSVAGFVEPGNRVDVLLTLRGGSNDATGGGSSTTLLQAVEILAVDQRLESHSNDKVATERMQSVTLLVTPDQVALLDLGQHMGTLTLSLRNPEDLMEAETQPATVNVLRFTQREPLLSAVASKPDEAHLALKPVASESPEPSEIEPALTNSAPQSPRKRRYSQVQTLRGVHAGRLLVRVDHK